MTDTLFYQSRKDERVRRPLQDLNTERTILEKVPLGNVLECQNNSGSLSPHFKIKYAIKLI